MTTKTKEATTPAVIATIPAESLTPAPQEFLMVDLEKIHPSKTNPRKNFDPAKMAELVESVRRHGVLQPILVRRPYRLEIQEPAEGSKVWYVGCLNLIGKFNQLHTCYSREEAERKLISEERFELVAGERRFRAAKEAGLSRIPATVRTLTDKEVLEIQVIENLQRADLEPLEEAEGYQLLMKEHGYSADELALKIGKSRTYVYGRIKLCDLPEVARTAMATGKISHSVALLIARIPSSELQKKATKDILERWTWSKEPMSYRDALSDIQRNYMLELKEAPFPRGDAELLPSAGPCTTCPKRTGNQPELFAGEAKDVCTDPPCFKKKTEAQKDRTLEEAKAKGLKVLTSQETKKVISYGSLNYNAPYVELTEACREDPKNRTYQKLLGKQAPVPVIAVDDRGRTHELLPKKDVLEALKAKGYEFAKKESASANRYESERKKREEKREIAEAACKEGVELLLGKMSAGAIDLKFWKLLAGAIFDITAEFQIDDSIERVAKRWGFVPPERKVGEEIPTPEDFLLKKIKSGNEKELALLSFEILLAEHGIINYSGEYPGFIKEACDLYGVNLSEIEDRIRAERKEAKAKKDSPQSRGKKKK